MEHQEAECNIVLAGGKLKLKFCIMCLHFSWFWYFMLLLWKVYSFSIEDELSVCPLFNKCYKKLIMTSGLPATSSLKRLEYDLLSVSVLGLLLAHSGKAKDRHYNKAACLHTVPSSWA